MGVIEIIMGETQESCQIHDLKKEDFKWKLCKKEEKVKLANSKSKTL